MVLPLEEGEGVEGILSIKILIPPVFHLILLGFPIVGLLLILSLLVDLFKQPSLLGPFFGANGFNNAGFQQGGKIFCQICNKFGHTTLDCYNRMNFSFQGRHPPAELSAIAAN